MKTTKKLITTLCTALCALFFICGCANKTDSVEWKLADLGEVDFHTELQAQYLAGDYTDISNYAKGNKELSRPEATHFSWSAETGEPIAYYTVEIKDGYNLYEPLSFVTKESSLDVYNLYIGTPYLWRVTGTHADGTKSVSPWSGFSTAETAPRNLYVDGITNVRDLGGWATPDGKVKQGMIYRCGRLNESKTPEVKIEITEDGIDTMRNMLGIKTEIDLRMPNAHNTETGGITSSPLGEDINYFNCPLEWDQGNYLTYNLESVRQFFTIASDIDNYPLIFHCDIGTDRTGMFSYLINGLLGVAEEDIYRDYLFSNFGNIGSARSLGGIMNNYIATVANCSGNTLSEKIENCLISVAGVPKHQLDAIKDILTEEL